MLKEREAIKREQGTGFTEGSKEGKERGRKRKRDLQTQT